LVTTFFLYSPSYSWIAARAILPGLRAFTVSVYNAGMSDTPNDSTGTETTEPGKTVPTLEEVRASLKAEVETTGKALMAAIVAYTEAVKKDHGFEQWMNGFDLGWKTSREHFRQEFEKSFETVRQANTVGLTGSTTVNLSGAGAGTLSGVAGVGLAAGQMHGVGGVLDINMGGTPTWVSGPPSPPPLTPTANDLVHQFIYENPGKRGIEIANSFKQAVFRLPERTVRTALHRLKTATPPKIKIVDGRWYPTEATSAEPQQLALGE
jgi:hypothetical protein